MERMKYIVLKEQENVPCSTPEKEMAAFGDWLAKHQKYCHLSKTTKFKQPWEKKAGCRLATWKWGQICWKDIITEYESVSLHFLGFSLTVHQQNIASRQLQHFANSRCCEKSSKANWTCVNIGRYCSPEQLLHPTYSEVFQINLPRFKISQNILKYSETFQAIVHLRRMVLPGLKYFSETGWPWSSTAVSSGTAKCKSI